MRKAWLLLLVLTAALVGWLFAPALSGGSSFTFRDAAHFYHPLFQFIRDEWGAGRVPLWNPYENLGVPLLAENTSSVFYPGKLLFALPFDYTWLYNVYIVGHVALAAATSYRLARHLRASTLGAIVGALSYAFSGNLLFQYCNVIFLVGAAWLPLALLYADRMLRERQAWASVGFGVVVALIVLGGDPHLAYNLGLISAGYALWLWWNERRNRGELAAGNLPASEGDTEPPAQPEPGRVPWRLIYLSLGTLVAGLIAAVQVLPSMEASPLGSRSHYDEPRTLVEYTHEAMTHGVSEVPIEGLWGATPRGHHSQIYAFSVSPWRAFEMLWPNSSGRAFPTYRRWLQVIGAESATWSPSLYFGLLPLLLALRRFSVRRNARSTVRALSWLATLATLGSLGVYGLGMLLRTILGTGDDLNVGNEVGGLYWLLTLVCPGYIQFRYPHKLFVLTGLALSMLAALGWRGAWQSASSIGHWLLAAAGASVAALIGVQFGLPYVTTLEVDNANTSFQGPFDWTGAWNDVLDGILYTLLLALALWVIFWLARRQPQFRQLLQVATLAVVAIDLATTQRCLIEFAPASNWTFETEFQRKYPKLTNRVYREQKISPTSSANTVSMTRHADAVIFDRQTLMPKYPLPMHIRALLVQQSVAGNDFEMLYDAGWQYTSRENFGALPDSVLDLCAVQLAVVGETQKQLFNQPLRLAETAYLGTRPGEHTRTWIVHNVEVRPEFSSRSLRANRTFTYQLLFPDNKPRDWRRQAVIETNESIDVPAESTAEVPPGEVCTIERDEPLRVEVRATLTAPGLVVLADQFFPGWELTVETDGITKSQPILRTNRVMRGVALPPGEHRLVYRYQPRSFYAGAAISTLSAAGVGIAVIVRLRRKRVAKPQAT